MEYLVTEAVLINKLMTTYIIFNSLVLAFLVVISILYYQVKKLSDNLIPEKENQSKKRKGLNWKVYVCLVSVFLLIIFGFLAPFIFTHLPVNENFDFRETGQVGDTVGGLMNPFIALAGVIVTGLAFYVQYKANQQQRELFEKEQQENKDGLQAQINNQNEHLNLQQFESQFYEMLKLHRDNVTEMKIEGYDFKEGGGSLIKYEKITEGRKIFVTMQKELEVILYIYKTVNEKLERSGFEKCYELFFSGIDSYEQKYPSEEAFVRKVRRAREKHMEPEKFEMIVFNHERKKYDENVSLNFNYKPFSGHASRLGHYFRHLFLLVKSVANSTTVNNYGDRMKYLKILRAQLSNHEQILLFYNWLSSYGARWENKENKFFSEYCMIHNLWYNLLFKDEFVSQQILDLKDIEPIFRQGKMFEIDDNNN